MLKSWENLLEGRILKVWEKSNVFLLVEDIWGILIEPNLPGIEVSTAMEVKGQTK